MVSTDILKYAETFQLRDLADPNHNLQEREILVKHSDDICAMKENMCQLKTFMNYMANQINTVLRSHCTYNIFLHILKAFT